MTDDPLPPGLADTLGTVARAAEAVEGTWWIIGGAAGVLAGLRGESVSDVDILADEPVARTLTSRLGGTIGHPEPSAFCHSAVLGRCPATPLVIAVMGDLRVRAGAAWIPLVLSTRVPVSWRGGTLFVPTAAEQARVCRLFGRPKDLARAARLAALAASA